MRFSQSRLQDAEHVYTLPRPCELEVQAQLCVPDSLQRIRMHDSAALKSPLGAHHGEVAIQDLEQGRCRQRPHSQAIAGLQNACAAAALQSQAKFMQ